MNRTDIISPIERLEKAEGPDRELDTVIHWELYGKGEFLNRAYMEERGEVIPRYTKSIDAALTLVPDECDYIRFVHDPSGSGWELGKFFFSGPSMEYAKLGFGVTGGKFAIALCIAALRARSEELK